MQSRETFILLCTYIDVGHKRHRLNARTVLIRYDVNEALDRMTSAAYTAGLVRRDFEQL